MNLPIEFETRIKELLGKEFDEYIKSFDREAYNGIRINTLKISPENFERVSPFPIERIPWVSNGYYYKGESQPAKHPYYYAGLYYIQEPSAMIPASLLPIEAGDKVLDLCAAPGGKSTELGARLQGEGLLVSNDISNSRAKALLKNIELHGIKNALVLSESPDKLERYYPEYFDKILIDAPCSGEGMFRKNPSMMKDWEDKGVGHYENLQKEIVFHGAKMLKPGGYMLYSTCTFSPEENEGVISYLLDEFPDLSLVDPLFHENIHNKSRLSYDGFERGRPEWADGREELSKCVRLWPHKVKGEGHFIALLKKDNRQVSSHSGKVNRKTSNVSPSELLSKEAQDFLADVKINGQSILKYKDQFVGHKDLILYEPQGLPDLSGLRILRQGLLLGQIKKKRFEPSQALANALKIDEYHNVINLDRSDMDLIRYLKGEAVQLSGSQGDGWNLICVDGYPLGWGKTTRGNFKNKYYPGWRWR